MENAYRPEAWHELYVMLGGAAAALAGLLFVAISLHLEDILRVPLLRTFARNNMIAMLAAVVQAAVMLVPQHNELLAAELLLINLFGVVMASNVLFRSSLAAPLGRKLRAAGILVSNLLGVGGAISLFVQFGGGLYVITASYLIFLCLAVSSAWALMVGVYQSEQPARRHRR